MNLCHELFKNKRNSHLFANIMDCYRLVVISLNDRIAHMCELIGDIKDKNNNSSLSSIMNAMQLTPFELLVQVSAFYSNLT